MKEDFDLVERTIVLSPAEADAFLKEQEANGADERDGLKTVRTVLLHWDDEAHTRVRAASYPGTVEPVKLKDGRVMVTGLWSKKALAQFGTVNAVEMAKVQTDALLPAYDVAAPAVELDPVNPD